ncbi:polysaccharide biosynthesis tyrosine autokinase [Thermoleptolyngbya sichuanensis A183]|uniref:Polysaccharide biosynthesis tyrosine autokinase n=1 Tax=Thermoleptolyngbya sichuanensis A183 TaxID=2737172 RepID=A0A6M8B9C0_9CYAN|nr:polysaccharide biosynthesis tyrosine autokinase [Thermoleptolyngbya sichuanensis]QKD81100.1 polysaccharide biosynthesis tyrosine autokinase [Thermoleptolyngbya sichuanensis A183]
MSTQSFREEVDIDLQRYAQVLKRRWLPAVGVFSTVAVLSTLAALSQQPSYVAAGRVLVKIDRTSSLTGLDAAGAAAIGRQGAVGSDTDPIATQVETIRSLPIAEATITALRLADDEGQPLSPVGFLEVLTVKPIPGTDMIEIGYQDEDPERAAAVVNKVIQAYRNNNIATNQADAAAARKFITEQLPRTEATVREAEVALQRFKEQNQVILLDEESRETVKAMKRLDDEIARVRTQFVNATTRSRELQQQLRMSPEQAVSATALSQSPAIQEVFSQLQQIQGQLDLERARYRPTHPTIATLEQQEALLQQRLQGRVAQLVGQSRVSERDIQLGALAQDLTANLVQSEVERVALGSQIAELARLQAEQRSRAVTIPRLEATQRELERRLAAAQGTYESLLQRLQEVQVAEDQTIDNVRVISAAVAPEKPAASSKKLILLGGLVLGSAMGVVTAFLLDLCDRSVKTIPNAQQLLHYPLLGVVPSWKRSGRRQDLLPMQQSDGSLFAGVHHAYRVLQSNLGLLDSEFSLKTLVVTSSVPQEGKSQVAANLAMAIAQSGQTVLLVDANFHHSTQHQMWNANGAIGLAEVLEGRAELADTIQTVAPSLELLAAGNLASSTPTSLTPQKLLPVIAAMGQRYDVVIFDTPALSGAADASTLGKLTDGMLLVVRPTTDVEDLKATRSLLNLARPHVLGIVANGVAPIRNPNRYFALTQEVAFAKPVKPVSSFEQLFPIEQHSQNGQSAESQESSNLEVAS